MLQQEIDLHHLVQLSPNELATAESTAIRQKITADAIDERQTNWYEEHRLEFLESNGIDPNNTWTFDADEGNESEPDVVAD